MNISASIDHLAEVIADEGLLAGQNSSFRDPRNPNFIFFDDEREIDPELKAFRDDVLGFEEWNAGREIDHEATVQVGMFTVHRSITGQPERINKAFKRKVVISAPEKPTLKPAREVPIESIAQRSWIKLDPKERKRLESLSKVLTRREAPESVTLEELVDDFNYTPDNSLERYQERQEARARANWIVQFYKRQMPTNDRWHRIIKALGLRMTDFDMELAVNPVVELRNVLKERVKYAPGPIDGTVFINPDGTRFPTSGTNPGSAKASFIKRHGLEEEFVSVDRVQYEGQRTSHYVVGTRKTSDTTASNYYDPSPSWKDFEGGSYAPRACALFRLGSGMTMPIGSRRLTVREFEQAIIAGAECYDNADEALAGSIESDFGAEGAGYFEEDDSDTLATERLYDGRVSLHGNMGATGRAQSSFTEEEDYLYGILRMIGDEHGQELMLLANQEPNALHRHFFSCGSYDGVVSLLQFVAKDSPEMLNFVSEALCGDEKLAHHMA